jgi:hypothetical protein
MNRCSIVGEPAIDEGAVVLRVFVMDSAKETTGRIVVCRLTGFDEMIVETFPKGAAPHEGGEYRAEAAEFAKEYAEQNLERFEQLFQELARRKG